MRQETGPQIGTEVNPQPSTIDRALLRLGKSHIGRVSIPFILAGGLLNVAGPVHGQEMPQPSFVVTDQDGITQEYALGDSSLALTPVRGEAAALDTEGNPPTEAEMSADLPSIGETPVAVNYVTELRWNETDPNKARLFSFSNVPGAQKQFNIDFNQAVPDDFVNPKTNAPFVDLKTGLPIKPQNLGEGIKLLMDLYQVPEFIAIGHDISELASTENHGYVEIEDPDAPTGFSPLLWDEWWIKPKDYPNAIVSHFYLVDSNLPVSTERKRLVNLALSGKVAETLFDFNSTPPDTYYVTNPVNTTERSRLIGAFAIKLKPVSLSTT